MISKIMQRLKKALNGTSVFKTWFISYIAIITVMLILVLWIVSVFVDIVADDAAKLKKEEINTFSTKMDSLTEECNLFAFKLTSDERFTKNLLKTPENSAQLLELKGAVEGLRKQMNNVNEFFVYIKDENCIINSAGYICTPQHYFDIYYKAYGISYDKWFDEFLCREFSGYHVFENKTKTGMERFAKFCYILPLNQLFNENATVFTEIDSSMYEMELHKIDSENDMSVLIYDKNTRYFEKGEYIPEKAQLDSHDATGEFYDAKINGEKAVINVVSSAFASWKYAFSMPYSVFWSKVIWVRRIGILILVLLAVLGFLGIYFITRYNYKAVAKIIKQIESTFSFGNNKKENEYVRINKMIDVAAKTVENQQKQERSNLLLKLLLGVAKISETEEAKKRFSAKALVAAAFCVPYKELFPDEKISDDERAELAKIIITNIFTELLSPYGKIEVVDLDNLIFVFFPSTKHIDSADSIVRKNAEKLHSIVMGQFNINIICGISNSAASISDLCVLYREALSAMNTVSSENESRVNIYSKKNVAAKNYYYPVDQMQYIITLIRKGEGENAAKQIEIIFEINSAVFENENLAKALVTDLATTIMKAAMNVGYRIDAEKLMECVKAPERKTVKRIFESYVTDICAFVKKDYSGKEKSIIEKINVIIGENYKNTEFNVNMIADILDMNPNSLSVVYKRKTDTNILENINKLRVNEAKKLLIEGDETLESIASLSGFGSIATFRRVFKLNTGVSPAEYRKMKKKGE